MSSSRFAPVAYGQVHPQTIPGVASERARGYAAGYSDGARKAEDEHQVAEAARQQHLEQVIAAQQAQVEQAIAAIQAAVVDINARHIPLIEAADRTLVESGLDLAEAILAREVEGGHVTAADTLRRALSTVGNDQVVAVRLHPDDAAVLSDAGSDTVQVISDPDVARGDAYTMMDAGWVDARIASALARARAVLSGEHA